MGPGRLRTIRPPLPGREEKKEQFSRGLRSAAPLATVARPPGEEGVGNNAAMILYLAADLLWATKIKGSAETLGLACRPVRTMEMLEARLAERTAGAPVTGILLDLEKPDEALAMIGRLRGGAASDEDRRVRIVAFGPHVLVELFQRAREAGADAVMARGGLDRGMADVLRGLAVVGG